MRLASGFAMALAVPLLAGCPIAPPASQIPDAKSAIDRMRQTGACGTGVQASAKIDHFGKQGRIRGDLLMFASAPAKVRLDVISPFGATLATLTSDGDHFSLSDLRDKRFLVGPATACNIARFTNVPVPGHALVDLLRGQAPVLKHGPADGAISWSGRGYYVVTLPSTRNASEEIHLAPHPADFSKPWSEQRLRVVDVVVTQDGTVLYKAELTDHQAARTAEARVDPMGIDPPIPPSGPACDAEIPRRIHVEVPDTGDDVVFRYDSVTWNPPLPEGTFTQPQPGGTIMEAVTCE